MPAIAIGRERGSTEIFHVRSNAGGPSPNATAAEAKSGNVHQATPKIQGDAYRVVPLATWSASRPTPSVAPRPASTSAARPQRMIIDFDLRSAGGGGGRALLAHGGAR